MTSEVQLRRRFGLKSDREDKPSLCAGREAPDVIVETIPRYVLGVSCTQFGGVSPPGLRQPLIAVVKYRAQAAGPPAL